MLVGSFWLLILPAFQKTFMKGLDGGFLHPCEQRVSLIMLAARKAGEKIRPKLPGGAGGNVFASLRPAGPREYIHPKLLAHRAGEEICPTLAARRAGGEKRTELLARGARGDK